MCEDLVPVLHTCEFRCQFFTCDDLIILHRCKDLVPIRHTCEDLVPILHIVSVLHTLKTIKNVIFEHKYYITPQKLSKLTVREFHICQK